MKFKTVSFMLAFIFAAGSAAIPATLQNALAAETAAGSEYSETQNGDIIDEKSGFEYSILDDGTIELRAYRGRESELVIPETLNGKKVTSIAFFGGMLVESHLSTTVKSVVIPDSVTRLGNQAFENCQTVEKITIPDSVKEIGSRAFSGCGRLKSIVLPKGVSEIGEDFFWGCRSLETVSLPDSVTAIGPNAFYECSQLVSLELPKSVSSIAANAFKGCQSLKNIQVPEGIKQIESTTFSGCRSLSYINLPKSVTAIGDNAFQDCLSLKDIYYAGTNADWAGIQTGTGNDAFKNAGIHFETADAPQTDETQNDFQYHAIDGSSVEITWYSGTETEITIPDTIDGKTVTGIAAKAFEGNSRLAAGFPARQHKGNRRRCL